MKEIRNSQGKLVCRIDKTSKTIEIVLKGCIINNKTPKGTRYALECVSHFPFCGNVICSNIERHIYRDTALVRGRYYVL